MKERVKPITVEHTVPCECIRDFFAIAATLGLLVLACVGLGTVAKYIVEWVAK